jgi:O-antigen ligase
MGAIGISQFVGHDFFTTELATRILGYAVEPKFPMSYGTHFNPNTFGKYTAMLSPILLLTALTWNGKKIANAIFLLAGLLMLLGVFGSSSLGGLVGIVTASGILLVFFLSRPGVMKKITIASVPVIFALVLTILLFPPLNYRVTFLFNRLATAMRADTSAIIDFTFEENTMYVHGEAGEIFSMTVNGLDENWIIVRDASGNVIQPIITDVSESEVQQAKSIYAFDIPGYRIVEIDKFPFFFAYYHATSQMPFLLTLDGGRIHGLTLSLELFDVQAEIPAWGFKGRETWGSSRGYIWSRSFPLMPARTIIGSGPDTYINVFPKNDIVSMQRFFDNPIQTVDKAHNLFIQTWISTGGISAVALLALFGHYLLTTFLSLIKSKNEPLFSFGLRLGLLCGISSFCMSVMATDSTIGSTGVFFVLLGVGYGLNEYSKQTDDKAQNTAKQHN